MIKVGEELPSAKLFKLGEKGIDTIESTEYLADKKVVDHLADKKAVDQLADKKVVDHFADKISAISDYATARLKT